MAPRKILHLDLDAFFCAVEELLDPSLKGKTFAVGGSPTGRGVVSTCTYAARKFGVHSAMPMSKAIRLCPGLLIVHHGFGNYSKKSAEVMAVIRNITPLVEQISVDEAFLDVSDLPEPSLEIARMIQREINEKTSLPCSIGAASNKLVAKIANNIGKKAVKTVTYPNAIQWIPEGQEASFLAPLPVDELWGVGAKSAKALQNLGIYTIGQLATYPPHLLAGRFGRVADDLHRRANGVDDSPVHSDHDVAKSVSQEITFETDVEDEQTLRRTLQHQADQVGFRLRRDHLTGNTVKIKLRWSNFVTLTRQIKTDSPICQDSRINAYAQKLFDAAWCSDPRPVRLIGVGVTGIEETARQLSFLTMQHEREDNLLQAVDEIRLKYGKQSLKRAVDVSD